MTETIASIKKALEEIYPVEEINSMTRLIAASVCHIHPHQLLMDKDKQISSNEKKQIEGIVARLKQHEPIQYILGEAFFYDLIFRVDRSVLIPRQETEELVELIIKRHHDAPPLTILDIGTGSGCIAITLATHLQQAKVSALDISAEALHVAKANARRNKASVHFIHANVLDADESATHLSNRFDILVSNPPYVMEREKAMMHTNVLNHEPHLALFVADHDPLIFYRTIAQLGKKSLNPKGALYFEINPLCSNEMVEMLEEEGYHHPELICDLSNKNRFIAAHL